MQVNLPNLGGAPNVHRAGDAGHPATGGAFEVVGVDVQAHRTVAFRGRKGRTTRAQRLRQHHTHAAVQQAVRLACALIHWHARPNEVVAHLQKFNPQPGHRRVDVNGGEFFDRDGFLPDAHGSGSVLSKKATINGNLKSKAG